MYSAVYECAYLLPFGADEVDESGGDEDGDEEEEDDLGDVE